jgi:hypothetical protein
MELWTRALCERLQDTLCAECLTQSLTAILSEKNKKWQKHLKSLTQLHASYRRISQRLAIIDAANLLGVTKHRMPATLVRVQITAFSHGIRARNGNETDNGRGRGGRQKMQKLENNV